jgi:uncharacterized membrane protein YoaK (UPF0700 family)
VILIAIAGYVDANGFLALGHLFVSFMSGNSTQFAVHAVEGKWSDAELAVTLVGLYVAGVVIGRLLALIFGRWYRPVVLLAEATLLGLALIAFASRLLAITPLVLAMGVQNAAMHGTGEAKPSVTYVTGSLVHLGERLADALRHADLRWSWLPYALLWVSMVIGAGIGTAFNMLAGRDALIIPAAIAVLLAVVFMARELQR